MRAMFFWKCSKFNVNFKNAEKNQKKKFRFWDKCISIGFVKLSIFRREYVSLAVSLLTKSLKILHVTKRDLSKSITFKASTKYGTGAVFEIEKVFCAVYHVACQGVHSHENFETFI